MVKNILILVFIFCFFNSFAQEPPYTPMRLNYQFRGIKVDSLFLVPSFTDTTFANLSTMKNVAGAMIRTGNDFWMRNANTTAWLQNVNVGTGATVSTLNSPDRINGTATNNVDADMAGNDLKIIGNNSNTVSIQDFSDINLLSADSLVFKKGSIRHITATNKYQIKDFNATFLDIDTLGNISIGDLVRDSLRLDIQKSDEFVTIKSKNPTTWDNAIGIKSKFKTAYAAYNIDLSAAPYEIKVPGVYHIYDASVNNLTLPDPVNWPGQSITIINTDGGVGITYNGGFDPYIYDNTQLGIQWPNSIVTMFSDGVLWRAIYNK